jgi:hypothetical protein
MKEEKNLEGGYITLGPGALVFLFTTALSFGISFQWTLQALPDIPEGGKYEGHVYVGGSIGGSLRTMMSAEAQFQNQCVIDQDNDGTGEYGLISDMAGAPLRNGRPPVNPTFISQVFAHTDSTGFTRKSGFYYRSYVPQNTDMAEQKFVILAWPVNRGISGWNTYLLMESCEIYVWVRGDRAFSGANAPTLDDVFFGEPWVTPVNEWDWAKAQD